MYLCRYIQWNLFFKLVQNSQEIIFNTDNLFSSNSKFLTKLRSFDEITNIISYIILHYFVVILT